MGPVSPPDSWEGEQKLCLGHAAHTFAEGVINPGYPMYLEVTTSPRRTNTLVILQAMRGWGMGNGTHLTSLT